MKVGDLIQLSSYGIMRGYNDALTCDGEAKQAGLIIEIVFGRNYPYRVKWTKMSRPERDWSNHLRRELKHARR